MDGTKRRTGKKNVNLLTGFDASLDEKTALDQYLRDVSHHVLIIPEMEKILGAFVQNSYKGDTHSVREDNRRLAQLLVVLVTVRLASKGDADAIRLLTGLDASPEENAAFDQYLRGVSALEMITPAMARTLGTFLDESSNGEAKSIREARQAYGLVRRTIVPRMTRCLEGYVRERSPAIERYWARLAIKYSLLADRGATKEIGKEAIQDLARANLRFVISVAKKYQNRGVSLTDLIQEGNVGLVTAARKFDPEQGVKFISYAVWWIRQAILASLANHGRPVRVPLNRASDLARIFREKERLKQELGRDPTSEELGEATRLTPQLVESLQTLNAAEIRLDAPIGDSEDSQLVERFITEEAAEPELEVENRLLTEAVSKALHTLNPRDAKVLRLYFGLEGQREHTLEEIGNVLGVTRERIRQLRDRALKRLREGAKGKALKSFAA